ncbi:hypothetical protein EDB84DRAFT_75025 [Lactarius hengduanensis]|nr:hypothetical protein EDB84DRAFT_75025 [Lactarius hengduanensis]
MIRYSTTSLARLAFLSNTTARSTFQPLLTTFSFTLIRHRKTVNSTASSSPRSLRRSGQTFPRSRRRCCSTSPVHPRPSYSPTLAPPIRSARFYRVIHGTEDTMMASGLMLSSLARLSSSVVMRHAASEQVFVGSVKTQ